MSPAMHSRMLPTHCGEYTICFFLPLHSVAAKLNTSPTQHNAGVSGKQSARVVHALCLDTSLDLTETDPSTLRLESSKHWTRTPFSTAWCLGTRLHTPHFRKFLRSFSRPSCTSSGSSSSPLFAPARCNPDLLRHAHFCACSFDIHVKTSRASKLS